MFTDRSNCTHNWQSRAQLPCMCRCPTCALHHVYRIEIEATAHATGNREPTYLVCVDVRPALCKCLFETLQLLLQPVHLEITSMKPLFLGLACGSSTKCMQAQNGELVCERAGQQFSVSLFFKTIPFGPHHRDAVAILIHTTAPSLRHMLC